MSRIARDTGGTFADLVLDDGTIAKAPSTRSEISVTTALDCRYAGQSHELRVPTLAAFPAEHQRRNGYARPGTAVEVVALRVTATVPSRVDATELPVPERAPPTGPAVIAEPDCTVWVPPGGRRSEARPARWYCAGVTACSSRHEGDRPPPGRAAGQKV